MNKSIVLFCCFLALSQAKAQTNEVLRTDRPGQANCPFVVGKDVFQIQAGVDRGVSRFNNTLLSRSFNPSAFLKYGITEKVEVNANVGLSSFRYLSSPLFYDNVFGINAVQIGTRVNLFDNEEGKYSAGIQLSLNVRPFVLSTLRSPYSSLTALGLFSYNIDDKLALTINLGANEFGFNNYNLLYVTNLAYAYSNELSVFIESYGELNQAASTVLFDTGIGYLLNPNFQLDIYGGLANNAGINSGFVSAGITYKILPKK